MQPTDPFVAALQEWIEVFMRRSMRNFILYSKESGLSMSQVGALFHIHKGASGVTDLGDGLGITSAAASQMLERLVRQELILRSEDLHDRRVKHIVLTDKGRQVIKESVQARQSWLAELAFLLSEEEKGQIVAALNLMINKIGQLDKETELEQS
jgi:DNA-binding MarR family transcriptional regulator